MRVNGKIEKWVNSYAVRLPTNVLAVSGIDIGSKVDIHADNGRLVIKLHERTLEQQFDKLLAEEPRAAGLLALVKDKLGKVIAMTKRTTERCYQVIEKMER